MLAARHCVAFVTVFFYFRIMPSDVEEATKAGGSETVSRDGSPLVKEVFSMFKNYLEVKLEKKGKQLKSKSIVEKQVTQMKFKGNQKQFEHNAQVDLVFDKIRSANIPESKEVEELVKEGQEMVRKQQELIRIASVWTVGR